MVVFLMETKQGEASCERVRRSVQFDFAEYVEPIGSSGGLALWWTKEVSVTILHKCRNFLDCWVRDNVFGEGFFVTWVYGDPHRPYRLLNWETLKHLRVNRRALWICVGDFNEIACHSEKKGGRRKEQHKIDCFTSLIDDIGMEDL